MVVFAGELNERGIEVGAYGGENGSHGGRVLVGDHATPVLRHEDQVNVQPDNAVSTGAVVPVIRHGPPWYVDLCAGQVPVPDRADPAQREVLARTFGCCRVVFNDALRCRDDAFRAGEKLTPTETQRQVITRAKTTEARVWLSEVASVALVQSVRDAHRAYQNFFDSIAKRRGGRRVGRPRLKSRKDNRQSFRLTRNGFGLRSNGRLYLAKVGEVKVRWSRELPSEPSSVTIVREPDGHYYASFVVRVVPTPLPRTGQECGVDLGVSRLATVATTTGARLDTANPKHLARKMRQLARVEREKSRRVKGSANRARSRRRVAVQHGKVSRVRRDYHHKQALTVVRENQAVFVEDLNVAGMVRDHCVARAISDAGFGQFVRLVEEKAERFGRTVHKINRWFPSSKLCSACGVVIDTLPLSVRSWTCRCGATHDRDHNAAINILAVGQTEKRNACGVGVSPPSGVAVGDEAGTTPDAA